MGRLKRFNLSRIIREFDINYLFETGTWKGDSIAYARKFPFSKIYSSEIIPDIAEKARARFAGISNIEIITACSEDALNNTIGEMKGNCLFWLDAHFPGAEEGISGYNETQDEVTKLPLEREIDIITRRKKEYLDVILVDDLRIYETGPFKSGNMPEHILRPKMKDSHFIENAFGDTHKVIKSYEDEGYLLILPKVSKPAGKVQDLWDKFYNNVRHKIH